MDLKTLCAVALIVLFAQSQPPPAPAGRAPQPQPIRPVAVSALTANPDLFVGGPVSLTAAVEQRYGASAFSIDQDRTKSAAQDVLVLAPVLTAPVEPNTYVTVIGEVVRFDLAAVMAKMKDTMPALTPEVVAKYRGRTAIIASSVINTAMTDLAKRLPPPMTPEEEALSKLMKQVGPGFNALRQAVTAANGGDAATHAAALKKHFTETAAFWKTKTYPDAIQWNEDAKRESDALAAAATRSDWDAVKALVPKLQAACASCHGQYRERLDDGTYRFKPAVR
jgi:cytochrome c556